MGVEQGVNLALDKILQAAQEDAVLGTPEPEQLERRPRVLPQLKAIGGQPLAEEEVDPEPPVQPAKDFPVEFPLTNTETGEEFSAQLWEDMTVWSGGKQVGSYNPDTNEFVPLEPTFWQKVGVGALQAVATVFEQFKKVGVATFAIKEALTPGDERDRRIADQKRRHDAYLVELADARATGNTEKEKELLENAARQALQFLESGEIREKFDELPWYMQLLYESPAWIAAGGVTATGIKAALAKLAVKPGVAGALGQTARVITSPIVEPLALVEKGAGLVLSLPFKSVKGLANLLVKRGSKKLTSQVDDIIRRAQQGKEIPDELLLKVDGMSAKIGAQVRNLVGEIKAAQPIQGEGLAKKLTELVQGARKLKAKATKEWREELQDKVAAYSKLLEKGEGREAFEKAKMALKGKKPGELEALAKDFTPDEIIAGHNMIRASKELLALQKLSASDAFHELLFLGKIPAPYKAKLLGKVFGQDFVNEIMKRRLLSSKMMDMALDIANLPRAVLASWDLSAPLRQGILLVAGHPIATLPAWKAMFKSLRNEENVRVIDAAIKGNRYYAKAMKSGLDILAVVKGAPAKLSMREEVYMTSLSQWLPGIRHSERSFITFLNKSRADVFYQYCRQWEGRRYSQKVYSDLADVINMSSGRASLGKLNSLAPFLNTFLFSPKLQAARIMLPIKILMPGYSAPARKAAIRNAVSFISVNLTLMGMMKISGIADINLDPKSTDFLKIKIGNTRIDPWAGFQQYVRLMIRITQGERKTEMGEIIEVNTQEALLRFFETKLSPVVSLANDILRGETFLGEEMTLETEDLQKQIRNRMVPLFIQDVWDAMHEDGLAGAFSATPGFFGVGIVSYPPGIFSRWEEKIGEELGKEFIEKNRSELMEDFRAVESMLRDYFTMPAGTTREHLRENDPALEAELYFWGEIQSISNPEAWAIVKKKLDKYNMPESAVPIRKVEEPWEAEDKNPDEIMGDMLDMLPKFIRDEVWANRYEWQARDLEGLIPVLQERRLEVRDLIDKYNRVTMDMDDSFKATYRRDNPELDAALNFWGRVTTAKSQEARDILTRWAEELKIPLEIFPALQPSKGKVKIIKSFLL